MRRLWWWLAGSLLGGFIIWLVGPFFAVPRLKRELIADATASRTRVMREGDSELNELECIDEQLRAAPELAWQFRTARHKHMWRELSPWLSGKRPFETLPANDVADMAVLEDWASVLRGCSRFTRAQGVPEMLPWHRDMEPVVNLEVFSLISALEVRRDLSRDDASSAALRCQQSVALVLDATRAQIGAASLRDIDVLLTPCISAWQALTAEQRHNFAPTWSALRKRLVSPKEQLEASRIALAIHYFEPLLNEPDVSALVAPRAFRSEPLTAFERLRLLRAWSSWDRGMRALAQRNEYPAPDDYAALMERLSEDSVAAAILEADHRYATTFELLPWLAEGAEGSPPISRLDARFAGFKRTGDWYWSGPFDDHFMKLP